MSKVIEEKEIYQPTNGYCINCGIADLVSCAIDGDENEYIVCKHRKACERMYYIMKEESDYLYFKPNNKKIKYDASNYTNKELKNGLYSEL